MRSAASMNSSTMSKTTCSRRLHLVHLTDDLADEVVDELARAFVAWRPIGACVLAPRR